MRVKVQKSFQNEAGKGILYIVPTPIGNLEDITLRALRILKEVDLIAAEDTRNTRKLLNHFQIVTKIISYHEHNKEQSGKQIIALLKEGKQIALVSDAGTPAISDPGFELVKACIDEDLPVISLPGANAALTALTASGIQPQPFYFYGFLHRKKREKKKEIEHLLKIPATIILYESPHRLKETVQLLYEILGDRKIVVGRELTKIFEEYIRTTTLEFIQWNEQVDPRGEYCLIIEGKNDGNHDEPDESDWWQDLTVTEHVNKYINEGLSTKEAIKQTAKDRQMGKREVYQIFHVDEQEKKE